MKANCFCVRRHSILRKSHAWKHGEQIGVIMVHEYIFVQSVL